MQNRTLAIICKYDGRYAYVNRVRYPVLFLQQRIGRAYEEDMRNRHEFPKWWTSRFEIRLASSRKAVLADYVSDDDWQCVGLHRIYDVCGGNFLSCRIGDELLPLWSE